MTLKTLADVRKLLSHIPAELLSTLAARRKDSVALRLVLQVERVPHSVGN
jgi:hypothetical protein